MLIVVASLRVQTNTSNKQDFPTISPERYAPGPDSRIPTPCHRILILTLSSSQGVCRLHLLQSDPALLRRQLDKLGRGEGKASSEGTGP